MKTSDRQATTYIVEATRTIAPGSVAIGERFIAPTERQIEAMTASLKTIGQLTPIMVHPVARGTYRIVAGCTRLKAALELGWTKIRADIVVGSADDYEIIQLVENADRSDLTAAQKKAARARIKELTRKKLEELKAKEPAKGGRGNTGGLRKAARQAGVPRTTAQRVVQTKLAQNLESGPVYSPPINGGSVEVWHLTEPTHAEPEPTLPPPKTASHALDTQVAKISIGFTVGERKRIDAYNEQKNRSGISISDCVRSLVRNALKAEGF